MVRLANLFELVGSVIVDTSEAEAKIDALIKKAQSLGTSLGSSVGVGGSGSGGSDGGGSTTIPVPVGKKTASGSASGSDNDTSGTPTAVGGKGSSAKDVMVGALATQAANKVLDWGKQAFKTGIDFNASTESYVAGFKTLLKTTTEDAESYVAELRQFAKDTPFAMEGVSANAQRMLSSGFKRDEVIAEMTMLGNVAKGNSENFDSLIRAYSQIKMFGKLRAQETYQLIDAGVPINDLLAEHYGVTLGDIEDMRSKNKISAEDVTAVLTKAYEGKSEVINYHGAMDAYMSTYAGQKEKLGDASQQAAGVLTRKAYGGLKDDILPWVTEFLEGIVEADKEWEKQRIEFGQWKSDKASQVALNEDNVSVAEGLAGKYAHWTDRQKALATIYASSYNSNYGVDRAKEQLALEVTDEEMQSVVADIHTLFRTYENPLELTGLMFTDDAAAELQQLVSEIPLSSTVKLIPDGSFLPDGSNNTADHPHANGLDRVPFDGYRAVLHKNEAVLTSREADMWRNGSDTANTGRLEALMQEMLNGIREMNANAMAGTNIVLDSGVLVGQLAPGIDARLGTISKRKGRS